MIDRRCTRVFSAIALIVIVIFAQAGGAENPWYYTIGEERSNQQANFCLERRTVFELARIFKQEGPRPGYAALDRTRNCSIRVESFTPREIITRVTIEAGGGGRYTLSFVEVQTSQGAIQYLVTTREVLEKN